ncbi:GNAT family N-acetyltransferase [Tenacibaculum sp. SZ-18]|uniref:GNAT family N-acetyltransferase n=1 Tax=Tenacibaculum sp. SZ-18 TaxID=754423 RepID=UPI000C2D4AB9|nr:GNAT family N-acetyltransferase [Tenacibaculum sp. SZ-18]AUC15144.1 GNAT family N-acetyltransferase [Tenacibaculum sp. SZ-18]
MKNYIFTSERLGFRKWELEDVETLHELNSNEKVMQYFPSIQTKNQSVAFIERMRKQFEQNMYCYFAVEIIESKEFIGFIGISEQTYETDFNPSVDIGWRVLPKYWGKGYATEGAKQCLYYAFNIIKLKKIVSVAPVVNTPSITVMKKIGMQKVKSFHHPLLKDFPKLEECVLYEVDNSF